jgi:hypothetical protein
VVRLPRIVVVVLVALLSFAFASSADAVCDTSAYWNIASQYHAPGEGHACLSFGPSAGESLLSTFGSWYPTIRGFTATASGSWTFSFLVGYNVRFYLTSAAQKVGVQNNHPETLWVNSQHLDW